MGVNTTDEMNAVLRPFKHLLASAMLHVALNGNEGNVSAKLREVPNP